MDMHRGKLSLVGIGISDERGISLAGLFELKACGKIFAEDYTNIMPPGTLLRLEGLCGKKITLLSRELVEGETEILGAAKGQNVALVVAGDPMVATTHSSLVVAARKKGVAVEIFHASSILPAAAGQSGLQVYKFGKTATLAYWRENYKPMAAYDAVCENAPRNLHTLLLLDIDEKLGPMKPSVAAEVLLKMEKEAGRGILSPETKVVLLKGIGWGKPTEKYCAISGLAAYDGNDGPAVIIVPGKLHFLEEEFLSQL